MVQSKRTQFLILLVLLSLLLNACATAAPTLAPTNEPATAPTQVPTALPSPTVEAQPDVVSLWTQLIADLPAEKGFGTVSAAKLNEELADKPPFLLDVREAAEIEKDGYIEDAVHIPVRDVLKNLDKLPAQDQPIVIYCASGHRGALVQAALKLLGYSNVRNLGGGLGAWKKANLPVVTGSMPPAPAAGTAPEIKDQALYTLLDGFLSNLPEGFYAIKADKLNTDLIEGKKLVLVDVRTAKEYENDGRIAGAINLPFNEFMSHLGELPKDVPLVIYCASGHRGAILMMGLRLLGYDALNLAGGLNAWKAAQLPVEGWVDWNATWKDFLSNLPKDFYTISAADLNAALADKPPFLLDVRETVELEKEGYIKGAVHIPVREVLKNLDKLPAQNQPIVIYCASGHRGALVMAALRLLGYSEVRNLGGGLGAWKKANLPVETGSLPEPPVPGTAPEIKNQTLFKGLDDFLSNLPDNFYTIKAADLQVALGEASKPFLLDVRTAEELKTDGYIEGSVHIPVNELFTRLNELPQDKATPIVVLCKSGHRGALALIALRMIGYSNVSNLAGGLNAWVAAQFPVVK